eukprot:3873333-Pyramimonas_sp.AAC.1
MGARPCYGVLPVAERGAEGTGGGGGDLQAASGGARHLAQVHSQAHAYHHHLHLPTSAAYPVRATHTRPPQRGG